MNQSYRIAGIDIHKKMLAVVVTEIGAGGEFTFERRKFGTLDSDLKELSPWLAEREVKVVVMESTAQYWRSVWFQLEGQCALHLAQAQSNRAPRGRKRDFDDAQRLVPAICGRRADSEFRAGSRTAFVADADPDEISTYP